MRVSDKMNYDQAKTSLMKNRQDLAELQSQAATMKKINRPSQDPVGATRVLAARTDRQINDQFLRSAESAKTFLELSEQSLGDLNEELLRIKELALGQSNDPSSNSVSRRAVATEVEQILQQIVNIGNRKLGNRFLFGGFQTERPPFNIKGDYSGDVGEIAVEVNKGVYLPINMGGHRVFLGLALPSANVQPEAQSPADGATAAPASAEVKMRSPASVESSLYAKGDVVAENIETPQAEGVNVFSMLHKMIAALHSNDKYLIQDTLEDIDKSLDQVIVARAELGSRSMVLSNTMDTLRKANVEARSLESQMEDADVYDVFVDMGKAENTLKASLSTSGKLIQPSLLDFLR